MGRIVGSAILGILAMCAPVFPGARCLIGSTPPSNGSGTANNQLIIANTQLGQANRQLAEMQSQLGEANRRLVATEAHVAG